MLQRKGSQPQRCGRAGGRRFVEIQNRRASPFDTLNPGRYIESTRTLRPPMKHWRETAEIVERVVALASAGRRAALATVIRIEGSSYRRPGAKLLIEDDGRTLGGVSGGCLEADVREVALRVIRDRHTATAALRHRRRRSDRLGTRPRLQRLGRHLRPAGHRGAHAGFAAGDSARVSRVPRPFAISTIVDGPSDVGRTTILERRRA